MTEQEAFEAAIREHPEDDTPRLVYADWLDEHGEEDRANFIRAQCAGDPEATQRYSVQMREWTGLIPTWCEGWRFHRGFIEEIHVHVQAFLEHAETLFQLAPIRAVKLLGVYSEHLTSLARLPQLASLAVLLARGTYRHLAFSRLCASPYLGQLRGLAVEDTPIGRNGLLALLNSEALAQLTHLHLGATGIGMEGVEMLARSPNSRHLIALDLRGNGLEPRALHSLDRSPYLGNLRRLGLWYNRLGDEGIRELVRLPLLQRLEHLSLGNNRLTARGLQYLAEAPALSQLRTLWLGVDRYGATGIEAIAFSPHLHPQAQVSFWLNDYAPQVRRRIEEYLGERVNFDDPGLTWERDPSVGWPLWQPSSFTD